MPAYETLTTQPLFDQESETEAIRAHVAHDGWPTPLRSWYQHEVLSPLSQVLYRALRRDPKKRIAAGDLRKRLSQQAEALKKLPWPFVA